MPKHATEAFVQSLLGELPTTTGRCATEQFVFGKLDASGGTAGKLATESFATTTFNSLVGSAAQVVSSVRAVPNTPTSVSLSWTLTDPGNEVTSVVIKRNGTTVATLGKVTSWSPDTVAAGGTYLYEVRPFKGAVGTAPGYDLATTGSVAAGTYSVVGTQLRTPTNQQFIPVGGNIGVSIQIGGNNYSDESTSAAHIKEALDWGWNTVRITTYVCRETPWIGTHAAFTPSYAYKTTDRIGVGGNIMQPKVNFTSGASYVAADWNDVGDGFPMGRAAAIAQTFAAADRYLAAGMAVIIAPMDVTQGIAGTSAQKVLDLQDFATQFGDKYKTDLRCWLNVNEPTGPVSASSFSTFHTPIYNALRATGAQNILIVDTMVNAQDAPWGKQEDGVTATPKVHHSSVGPAFISGKTNVAFGSHWYGGLAENADSQATFNTNYSNYIDAVHGAGLCMIVGEAGYRVDGRDFAGALPGDFQRNQKGFRSAVALGYSKGTGALVWDGTFDMFSLKKTLSSNGFHGQPFWYAGAWGDLSPMGMEFWNFCQLGKGGITLAPQIGTLAPGTTSQRVPWTLIPGATSYTVEYKLAASSTWTSWPAVTTSAAVITGLTLGGTYHYRVKANGASGSGPYSSIKVVTNLSSTTFTDGFTTISTTDIPNWLPVSVNPPMRVDSGGAGPNWTGAVGATGWRESPVGPATFDQEAKVVVGAIGTSANQGPCVGVRMLRNTAQDGVGWGFWTRWNGNATGGAKLEVFQCVNGTNTMLNSSSQALTSQPTDYTIRSVRSGGVDTISVFVNGSTTALYTTTVATTVVPEMGSAWWGSRYTNTGDNLMRTRSFTSKDYVAA